LGLTPGQFFFWSDAVEVAERPFDIGTDEERGAQAELIVEAMKRLDEIEPENQNKHDYFNKVVPMMERIEAERQAENGD